MKAMILSAAFLISGAAPIYAEAQSLRAEAHVDSALVTYADLDLTQADGARILGHRLNVAARYVCRDANLAMSHYRLRHLCIKDALADAWGQVAVQRTLGSADNGAVMLAAVQRRP
ncbi:MULTISPECIES: UrcA family protein [unclassified Brevundimonas]|uniref:UrcA family protein n=1 Tax=unclassified Brevundimonas TaxID=2622653 RepID=UPI003F92A9E2